MSRTPGTKPTPRNLRVVRGIERPDRQNDDEPVLPISIPNPPEHLNDAEQNVFREMARKLARMRVMSEADIDALSIYAVNFREMVEANDRIRDMGLVVRAPKTNVPMHNPFLSIRNNAQKTCLAILTEFGMTPSSRTRVKAR
jgi:P27 family predicted phage terminase small subunit